MKGAIFMISLSSIEAFKACAEFQVDLIHGGVMYFIVEENIVTWKLASKDFDISQLRVGEAVSENSSALQAIQYKKVITDKIPRNVYGVRITITSSPIVNEQGEVIGAFSVAFPKLHAVVAGFDSYAPIFAKMFSEGAFIYATDLEKVIRKQSSQKFDVPAIKLGYELKERDIAYQAIKSKQIQVQEVEADRYGVPTLIMNYPLFNEDDIDEVVATIGIVLPRDIQVHLRDMSDNLVNGLTGIASAIEELAVSAANIHTNEQVLNNNIEQVYKLSDEINKISAFIKSISEQTNMLGLNAAIEAARAGEAGRGFSIVAEEIRKLSDQSKSTVPKIKSLTDEINTKLSEVSKMSEESILSSQEQASATQEITAGIEELTSLANQLDTIAKKMA